MQLHQLKPQHKRKTRKRIGRGGKRGTYSGRGQKGQKSRAGASFKPVIRGFIKRYPKLRGYRFNPISSKPVVINLSVLEKEFNDQETVNPETLIKKGIVDKIKGKIPKIKILGQGELTKSLSFENCLVSEKAKEKIKKAKGNV